MTWQDVMAWVLLALGVGVELLCCTGMVAMRTAYARLHYVGPATVLGPILIAAAVVCISALSEAGIKAILIALVLVTCAPIVTHATGRAARLRHYGSLDVQPGDRKEVP